MTGSKPRPLKIRCRFFGAEFKRGLDGLTGGAKVGHAFVKNQRPDRRLGQRRKLIRGTFTMILFESSTSTKPATLIITFAGAKKLK